MKSACRLWRESGSTLRFFSPLGALAVLCARTGGTITGAECVNKSFPDFFEQLRSVGVTLTEGE